MTGIFGNTSFAITRRDNNFSPTLSLSYKATDDVLLYARFAQGFKSAGFNTDFVVAGVSNLQVDPERATSYEAGIKSDLLDKHLRFNLAGFYTSYKNLQLSQIVGAGVSLNNAAKANIHGIEAEAVAVLGQYVRLNGSIGYLHATYADFPGCPKPGATPLALSKPDCAGNYLNLAPKLTAALSAQFTYPVNSLGNFVARADWNYRSKVYFEPQNTDRLSGGARSLINMRAGLVTEHWELFAWVKNLTNKVYVNYADDRSAIFINTTQAYGDPRTFGVTGRVKF